MRRFLTIVGLAFGFGFFSGYLMGCQKPAGPKADDRQRHDVVLTKCGPNKIKVIKLIRELTGMGLKEAVKLVENLPSTTIQDCDSQKAQKAVSSLEKLGAQAEIR